MNGYISLINVSPLDQVSVMPLFQHFSDVLCFLIEFRVSMKKCITNYLDDFLFIARMVALCNYMIQQYLDLCEEIGVPIASDKTEWADEIIIFLGVLLDRRHLILAIPNEKREMAVTMLTEMCNHTKCTVKDLQRLCGYLNF